MVVDCLRNWRQCWDDGNFSLLYFFLYFFSFVLQPTLCRWPPLFLFDNMSALLYSSTVKFRSRATAISLSLWHLCLLPSKLGQFRSERLTFMLHNQGFRRSRLLKASFIYIHLHSQLNFIHRPCCFHQLDFFILQIFFCLFALLRLGVVP